MMSNTWAPTSSKGGGAPSGGGVQVVTVPISSAQILALHTTPVTLIAGVAGQITVVQGMNFSYIAGSIPYVDSGGTMSVATLAPALIAWGGIAGVGFWDQSTNAQEGYGYSVAYTSSVDYAEQDVVLTLDTANPTLGNGTLKVTVSYFLAPAA